MARVMDPVWKKKWVEALRSGKYKQATNSLRSVTEAGDAFCCLGVLCDIVGVEWTKDGILNYVAYYDGQASGGVLPSTVAQKVGLGLDTNPEVKTQTLSGWNDDGHDFNTIADLIESGL